MSCTRADRQSVPARAVQSPPAEPDRRRPRWVYGAGDEPDPRFTLANERTILAWVRTSLALLAAGVALDAFVVSFDPLIQRALAATLVGLGVGCSGLAYGRWMRTERALRKAQPLPAPGLAPVLCAGLAVLGVVVLVMVGAQ